MKLVVALAASLAAIIMPACSRTPEPDSSPTPSPTRSPTPLPSPSPSPSPTPTPSSDAGPPSAFEAFCTNAYSADLDSLRAKCGPEEIAGAEGLARTAAKICTKDLGALLANGRASFDVALAAKCVQAVKQAPEKKTSVEGETFFSRAPCDRVVTGKQAEGAPCRWPPECKDGLTCVGYAVGVDGTCTKPAAASGKCTTQAFGGVFNETALTLHHASCASGAYCDGKSCVARSPAGAACTSSKTCLDGMACHVGKCTRAAPAAAGGACAKQSDCASAFFCDTAASVCAPKKSAGDVCTDNQCKGFCDVPTGKSEGKCVSSCGSG